MTQLTIARLRLALWILLIVTVVVPWGRFVDDAHWERVQWVPFVTPPVKVFDVVANMFFYAPYGYWYARQRQGTRHAIVAAVITAFALSVCTEATQLFSRRRFPSLTDVTSNAVGAFLGACWALAGSNPVLPRDRLANTRSNQMTSDEANLTPWH